MRLQEAAAAGALLLLAGCASVAPPPPLPLTIGNGQGSEHGNYPTIEIDEPYRGEDGSPCRVFEWDRPLNDSTAIRYRSATCPMPGKPGLFHSFNLDRRVMPLSESRIPGFLAEEMRQRAAQPPTDGRAPPPPAVSSTPLTPPKPR